MDSPSQSSQLHPCLLLLYIVPAFYIGCFLTAVIKGMIKATQ